MHIIKNDLYYDDKNNLEELSSKLVLSLYLRELDFLTKENDFKIDKEMIFGSKEKDINFKNLQRKDTNSLYYALSKHTQSFKNLAENLENDYGITDRLNVFYKSEIFNINEEEMRKVFNELLVKSLLSLSHLKASINVYSQVEKSYFSSCYNSWLQAEIKIIIDNFLVEREIEVSKLNDKSLKEKIEETKRRGKKETGIFKRIGLKKDAINLDRKTKKDFISKYLITEKDYNDLAITVVELIQTFYYLIDDTSRLLGYLYKYSGDNLTIENKEIDDQYLNSLFEIIAQFNNYLSSLLSDKDTTLYQTLKPIYIKHFKKYLELNLEEIELETTENITLI